MLNAPAAAPCNAFATSVATLSPLSNRLRLGKRPAYARSPAK
jgi:hypothetical protein